MTCWALYTSQLRHTQHNEEYRVAIRTKSSSSYTSRYQNKDKKCITYHLCTINLCPFFTCAAVCIDKGSHWPAEFMLFQTIAWPFLGVTLMPSSVQRRKNIIMVWGTGIINIYLKGSFREVLHPWTLFLKTFCIF